jgi:hypothetical protein
MTPSDASRVFLKLRRKPSRDALADLQVELHHADLLVLLWRQDFSDLDDDSPAAAELLWTSLGVELLARHRDERGVLVTPAALLAVEARDYDSGVAAYRAAGVWLPNVSRDSGGHLVALDPSELPLPRLPKSKLIEYYVVKRARALRELELTSPPLRTIRLELESAATPREVSAFYLPRLKEQGLHVKRRVWSSGGAERLAAENDVVKAVVLAERRALGVTFVQVSWALKS